MTTVDQRKKYVIGIDYGTDSVRAVLVDTASGNEIASDVFYYPRWAEGKYCDPSINQFRQHPLDYLEGLETTINNTLQKAPSGSAEAVVAISVDTTGSTPVAIDENCRVLAEREDFKDNPNGMFILWKDHTAVKEAGEINSHARSWGGEDFTRYSGGIYSSEWYWAKILRTLRVDEEVRKHAYGWIEHCDWIPAVLTGVTDPAEIKHGRCSAGHKAMWHESWDGLPHEAFLASLDPLLSGLRERLYRDTYTADQAAGTLSAEWAEKTGMSRDVIVGIGAFDAHMGAVGGQIEPYSLVKVIGTSTCDMLIAPPDEMGDTLVGGICGQVDGSVIPNMIGLEAGMSAFGDVYAWFKKLLLYPFGLVKDECGNDPAVLTLLEKAEARIIPELSKAAQDIPASVSAIVALDWLNGRRTPDADQQLKGALTGLNLGSDAPRIFRALVEATAYATKAIVDRFIDEGVPIKEVIAIGGVAKKSPFAMQTCADVLNMPIKVAKAEQTVALGAAMFAAVAGGVFSDLAEAQSVMGSGFEAEYTPNAENVEVYKKLYGDYCKLGNFVEKELTWRG